MTLTEAEVFPSAGCVGSIQWGIDTGRAFDIEGLWRCGRTIANADSHAHAMELAVSYDCIWSDEDFDFITPETLQVYRIGPHHDYIRSNPQVFAVRHGRAVEVRS